MSTPPVVRSQGPPPPVEVLHGQDYTFDLLVSLDDRPLGLASGTITITKSGTKYVNASAVTIGDGPEASSSNRITFVWAAAAHPADPVDGVTVVIDYAIAAGGTKRHRLVLDVVLVVPWHTVTEADLFLLAPELRDNRALGVEDGTATGGSTATLVDSRLTQFPDGYFDGGEVEILSGDNEGQFREIHKSVRSTGTVNLVADAPLDNAIVAGDEYRVRQSWGALVDEAWQELRGKLRTIRWGYYKLADPADLHRPLVWSAMAYAFEAIGTEDSWKRADEYRARVAAWLTEEAVRVAPPTEDEASGVAPADVLMSRRY